MKIRALVVLVCGVLSFHSAWASSGSQQLHRFLDKTRSLQARFTQSVLDENQQQAAQAQGIVYIQRPGRLRWDYIEPQKQQIIADGRQVWLYDPELDQASTELQDQAFKGTPAFLLSSTDPVEEHFEVIDIGSSQGFDWVELIPKDQESQFVRILVAFSDNEMQRLEMADKFGQVTRLQFYDIVRDPKLDPKLFKFDPPDRYELFHY